MHRILSLVQSRLARVQARDLSVSGLEPCGTRHYKHVIKSASKTVAVGLFIVVSLIVKHSECTLAGFGMGFCSKVMQRSF